VTAGGDSQLDTVVLDIDGTLVDSVYAHVWSWHEAFRVLGVDVPARKIHRAIGMGGDRLVTAVASEAVERAVGDQVRSKQSELYGDLSAHLRPTSGATGLLEALKSRGLRVVLASSGSRQDTEDALALLGADGCIDAAISGDDAEATKPDTEPVRRAVAAVDGTRALVVGDAVWDIESARRAGHPAVAVLTGGIARCELLEAGAADVFEDPAALVDALDDVLARLA
jgi:phosphoglycolate phosphatase-like HAD superfamily hydrolase